MSNDYKDSKFKELLDKLQQESWQLELLISGFAIFGLFTAFEPIQLQFQVAENQRDIYQTLICLIGIIACSILIFNLLIHVILRGLWIGALGLRYVSGDIDFEKLNYHNRFTKHLKKKIVSFDKYVATLENYCSVLFAVSFLLIFYVLGIFIVLISLVFVINLMDNDYNLNQHIKNFVAIPIIIFLVVGIILSFIDFITQGFLKKRKWLSKIYFPFYWVFSFLTLSFLYRPLVYNFLDNKFGKRLSFILVPFYIGIGILISVENRKSNYLDTNSLSSKIYMKNNKYEDLLLKDSDFVEHTSIQSKIITKPYIKVFRVFTKNLEDRIFNYHPSLKPEKDLRGLSSDIVFSGDPTNTWSKRDSLSKEYLKIFNKTHDIFIDSIKYNSTFLITKNKKNQLGFETYIPTKSLSEGQHLLQLWRIRKNKKDTIQRADVNIPFWHYKN
ncbi:hypothetical protein OD91_2413 [Lutibacter sp. Hel_I_33_5]|uniref:hypothetical protein n=1 Tax=Lutibacter sp. Hel_I_33_5 TaxID=1566289 RepID=UPI0011AAD733|nr:hypothetical protein [Lutibacter sp. Hel_I_33_5]TVZ57107.1 hypothetical protein OD91_2413 [Lutibacter sp. Hel_I_33_5]